MPLSPSLPPNHSLSLSLSLVFSFTEKMVEQKRYALFLATLDSEFVKKTYGGYHNVFVETFGDEGEHWDSFRVVEGEFPEEKDLEKYDGFVISGSSHDSFENDPWILRLCEIVKKLDEMKKKILGICFGHQVLSSYQTNFTLVLNPTLGTI